MTWQRSWNISCERNVKHFIHLPCHLVTWLEWNPLSAPFHSLVLDQRFPNWVSKPAFRAMHWPSCWAVWAQELVDERLCSVRATHGDVWACLSSQSGFMPFLDVFSRCNLEVHTWDLLPGSKNGGSRSSRHYRPGKFWKHWPTWIRFCCPVGKELANFSAPEMEELPQSPNACGARWSFKPRAKAACTF